MIYNFYALLLGTIFLVPTLASTQSIFHIPAEGAGSCLICATANISHAELMNTQVVYMCPELHADGICRRCLADAINHRLDCPACGSRWPQTTEKRKTKMIYGLTNEARWQNAAKAFGVQIRLAPPQATPTPTREHLEVSQFELPTPIARTLEFTTTSPEQHSIATPARILFPPTPEHQAHNLRYAPSAAAHPLPTTISLSSAAKSSYFLHKTIKIGMLAGGILYIGWLYTKNLLKRSKQQSKNLSEEKDNLKKNSDTLADV